MKKKIRKMKREIVKGVQKVKKALAVEDVIVKAHNVAKMNEVTLMDANPTYKCMNFFK